MEHKGGKQRARIGFDGARILATFDERNEFAEDWDKIRFQQ
jgi:hypothetical protein